MSRQFYTHLLVLSFCGDNLTVPLPHIIQYCDTMHNESEWFNGNNEETCEKSVCFNCNFCGGIFVQYSVSNIGCRRTCFNNFCFCSVSDFTFDGRLPVWNRICGAWNASSQLRIYLWDAKTIREALDACGDGKLFIAINLAFACSLRFGEICGLTWDCVNISDAAIMNDDAYLRVEKVLARVE